MRLGKLALFSTIALALTIPGVAATRTHRGSTTARKTAKKTAKPKFQSPRGIDDQRATEIQAALIKAGYLSGSPSGHWDSASAAAMQKVQADNGWQTKLVPDSRALIKLGLGPASTSASAIDNPSPLGAPTPTISQR
jgi:Putative peptidoglycan binding domain